MPVAKKTGSSADSILWPCFCMHTCIHTHTHMVLPNDLFYILKLVTEEGIE